ncbi:MAG: hypothetical protein JW837_11840 [Sedimentisphaerales bacterium]|nr:hypothetical protein [Sedimentisphaerales bacterium]
MTEPENSKKSSGLKRFLYDSDRIKFLQGYCPKFIKHIARRWFPLTYEAYCRRKWQANDPFADIEETSTYPAKVDVRLGIIKEFAHRHKNYVGACRDLGIPYKILDISGSDWIDTIRNSNCDAFLVYPSCELSVWKQMYDERLRVMVEDMGKIIYPTYNELWFYESKRRMYYWLEAHNIPHPQTWIFYNFNDAMQFARNVELPIVFKSDFGSAASGVRIFRSRSKLVRWIKLCFRKGIICKNEDPRDQQWGVVLFQEYLPDAKEWRIAVIGASYFGYEKLKQGDYHSGSLLRAYSRPRDELLALAKRIMDDGGFTSMALDIFEIKDGQYLVNELQTMFGMSRQEMCVVDGKAGRMLFQSESSAWVFESGDFCRNHLCNLRVQILLAMLKKELQQGSSVHGCDVSITPPAFSPNRNPDISRDSYV